MSTDTQCNDFDREVTGRKIPAFFDKYSRPGERHGGPLAAKPQVRIVTDYHTKEVKTFKSGEPMTQYVMEVSTELREAAIEGDDGTRRLYVRGRNKPRLKEAIRAAGLRTLNPGDEVWDTYVREDPETKEKIHSYEVKAGPNAELLATKAAKDEPPF